MSSNHTNTYRRFGVTLFVIALPLGLISWCVSPHAAQALGMPLAWANGSHDANASLHHDRLPDASRLIEPAAAEEGMTIEQAVAPISDPQMSATTYTLDDVTRWAHDYSPAASLIESEAAAVVRGIDTSNADGCCAARLIQDVLREVALARRSDRANEAAIAFHQLVAATQAVILADEAIAVQDKLIAFAAEAERLDIPDSNPLKLRQTRLDFIDMKTQQSFNGLKLRQELSRLTGRSETEVANALMGGLLPTEAPSIAAGDAVATALNQRHDLRALQILCRDLKPCNLDAARLLMGAISPGIGLSLATAASGILKCLQEGNNDKDLNTRRCQCQELQSSLQGVIRNETLQAVLDVRSAGARLKLVDEQIQLASARLEGTRGKIQIDEATPGSDWMVELEIYQLRGERLERQTDLAVAIDNLHHAQDN